MGGTCTRGSATAIPYDPACACHEPTPPAPSSGRPPVVGRRHGAGGHRHDAGGPVTEPRSWSRAASSPRSGPPPAPCPTWSWRPGFVDLQVNGIGAVDVAGAAGDGLGAPRRGPAGPGRHHVVPDARDRAARRPRGVPGRHRRRRRARPAGAPARHRRRPSRRALPGRARRPPARVRRAPRSTARWLESPRGPGAHRHPRPGAARCPRRHRRAERPGRAGVARPFGLHGRDGAGEAADAGARLVTHLGNAMGPLAPARPGAPRAPPWPTTAWRCRSSPISSTPIRCSCAWRSRPRAPGLALVTDAVADGAVRPPAEGGRRPPPRLADGTLAGSVLTHGPRRVQRRRPQRRRPRRRRRGGQHDAGPAARARRPRCHRAGPARRPRRARAAGRRRVEGGAVWVAGAEAWSASAARSTAVALSPGADPAVGSARCPSRPP